MYITVGTSRKLRRQIRTGIMLQYPFLGDYKNESITCLGVLWGQRPGHASKAAVDTGHVILECSEQRLFKSNQIN